MWKTSLTLWDRPKDFFTADGPAKHAFISTHKYKPVKKQSVPPKKQQYKEQSPMTTTPLLSDHGSDSPQSFIPLSFDHLQYFTQPFWPPLSFIPLYFDHPQSCLVCFDYPRSFLLLCFDHLQSFLLMLSTAVFYFHKYTHLTKGPRKKQFSN